MHDACGEMPIDTLCVTCEVTYALSISSSHLSSLPPAKSLTQDPSRVRVEDGDGMGGNGLHTIVLVSVKLTPQ